MTNRAIKQNTCLYLTLDSIEFKVPLNSQFFSEKLKIVIEVLQETKNYNMPVDTSHPIFSHYLQLDNLDIQRDENAEVYVFDKKGNIIYSIEKNFKESILLKREIATILERYSFEIPLNQKKISQESLPRRGLDMGEKYILIVWSN